MEIKQYNFQLYVNARWIRRDRQPLTATIVYGGKVNVVRTILNGRMETGNLERFLNIVGMFNQSASNGDHIKGIVSPFRGHFPTKSNHIFYFE